MADWGFTAPTANTPAATPVSTPAQSGWGFSSSAAPKVADNPKAPAATPSPFTAPLFGNSNKVDVKQPFQTPSTKIINTGNANIADSLTVPNPIPLSLPDQAAGKTVAPNLPQKIGSDIRSIVNTPRPQEVPITPESYLTAIYGPKGTAGQGGIVGDTYQAWQRTISDLAAKAPTDNTEKVAAIGQAGMDALSAFFKPVSDVFEKAAHIPGTVGKIADSVNAVFSTLGAIGGDSAESLIQANSKLTQKQKDILSPLAQQIGALGAQIIAGKAGEDTFGKLKDTTHSFVSALNEDARIKELGASPGMQQHIANLTASQRLTEQARLLPVTEAQKLPIRVVNTDLFQKSAALPDLKKNINSTKATEMDPILRGEIRASLKTNGSAATHAALVKELGAGDRQAESLVREAPTPQTVAEEAQAHQSALRSAVGEKNLAPDKMPVIQMGAKPKDTLPSVDINEAPKNPIQTPKDRIDALPPEDKAAVMSRTRSNFGKGMDWADAQEEALTNFEKGNNGAPVTVEPIKGPKSVEAPTPKKSETTPNKPVSTEISSKVQLKDEKTSVSTEPAPKPLDVDPGTSKVGKSIEAKAIESNLTKGYGDETAKYDATTFKEQARIGKELSDSGTDNLRAVIRGDKPLPEGLKPFGLIAAAEEHAKMHPEQAGEILSELANSKAATQTSEAASGLSLGRMREPDSVTAKLQQIKRSLVEAAGGSAKVAKARATLVKGARAARDAVNLSKEELSWNKFLDQITC